MLPGTDFHLDTGAWRSALMRGVASWWHMIRFAAIVLVLALSPSTYNRTHRAATSRHIYTSTWQVLPWFTTLAALLSLVLIRIVVVTALDVPPQSDSPCAAPACETHRSNVFAIVRTTPFCETSV
jgi:phospholipid/cholesterol/gamma-HCH transport system permease protein